MNSLKFASPWQRIGAFALDYLVILAYIAGLVAATLLLRTSPLAGWSQDIFLHPNTAEIGKFVTLTGPVILYFAIMDASPWQATLGKHWLNLRVTTTSGERISIPRSFVRTIVKFLPWELAHAALWHIPGWPMKPQPAPLWVSVTLILVWVLVAWYLIALWVVKAHRTPYDRLAGTITVSA